MTRWRYFARRLVLSIPILIFGTTATFWIIRAGPIDPAAAIIGPDGDQQAYQRIRDQLGLDEPLWQQYIDYMVGMFTGDFGQSWVLNPDTSTIVLLQQYAPRTMWLGFWSVLIALFIGIPLGFYAGLNPNSWSDYVASFGGIVWRAMPNFWLAVILVSLLSQSQQLFGFSWQEWIVNVNVVTAPPLDNLGDPQELLRAIKWTLPAAIVLGSSSMGNEMRIGRTAVLETKNSNYVEAAKARGIPGRSLVWKHVFRNALVPLVPIITGEAFLLIGGSVLVETVFAINGLGYLFFDATINGDLPLVGTLMFVFILLIVIINIVQDLMYTLIDPRVGYEGGDS
ncbi:MULTISPECIES: ABC transporter permease [Halolamina]|uniref:Peptide/nickel transport system permease protein n=1 Tax=Halolamina pelagica TaxID=699431 RepID=A0A1I5VY80_9EURY|nr:MULTISPECIES: ABC transporter permease [Halolamina]NHX37530.1 ABC transporter permease [Halolamina sp. R1-12]SFQ11966.1 peptide/nickel transport system permease protein [Halolamina pelagica]